MKLKEVREWIKKIAKKEEVHVRKIDKEDPYATIKHKTKTLGFRHYSGHNNRKRTRGRNVQYVTVNGRTKPIYHGAL